MFTLPGPIADIAYQNKAVIYDLLFKAAAEATLTIAADPRHLGARIGITAVLHSWGLAGRAIFAAFLAGPGRRATKSIGTMTGSAYEPDPLRRQTSVLLWAECQ